MFIIDFDDTLFNTHAFKQARAQAVKGLGVSDELFWKTYKEAYNNDLGINVYSDERHAEILERYGFEKQAILAAFEKIKLFLKDYLFSDAVDLLENLKKSGQKLILLSLGQADFQKVKIESVGISKYFDEVYTVDDTKEHIIANIINSCEPNERVWFINDKIEETKKLIQHFPRIKPLLKVSPAFSIEDYQKSGIPFFSTWYDIKEYARQRF